MSRIDTGPRNERFYFFPPADVRDEPPLTDEAGRQLALIAKHLQQIDEFDDSVRAEIVRTSVARMRWLADVVELEAENEGLFPS